jgi:N-acetylglutamate synthase-like GNAT family acetyltransferase
MHIRSYRIDDRPACLGILASNTPEFFVAEDRVQFAGFLDDLPGPYFVVEHEGVQGCGGWAMDDEDVAVLTWGMVTRDLHRRGIGTELFRYRLNDIRMDGRAGVVRVRTVQLVQEFFARQGFRAIDIVPDGFGPGLDRVTMHLEVGP